MLPKADLHLHQEWSARLDRVRARRLNYPPFDWAAWRQALISEVSPGLPRLQRLSRIYPAPLAADTDDAFVARVYDALSESAIAGACYAELRFGHDSVLRPRFMTLFRQAEEQVKREHPRFQAEAVASLLLWHEPEHIDEVLEACVRAADEGLAGVDLMNVPYASEADWRGGRSVVTAAREAGLGVTVHAGEFSSANIAAVAGIEGVTRIGHATHAADDPWLLELLAEREVTVEVCLTGNVVLGAVETLADHPLRRFIDAGIKVALGTDNPVQFGTTIAEEYHQAAQLGLDASQLRRVSQNAVDAAFTTAANKRRLGELLAERDAVDAGAPTTASSLAV